jgi:hypothetical protein
VTATSLSSVTPMKKRRYARMIALMREAASCSTRNSLAPTTSVIADDDAPNEVQDDSSGGGDEAGMP